MAKIPVEIQQQIPKIKVTTFKVVPISRLPVLAALNGSRPNEGTCIESNNANVSNDVNPTTNVEEMESDDLEDDNISCLQNEIINKNNSSNVDSILRLNNHKTLNILGQERNDFWCLIKKSPNDCYKQKLLYNIEAKVLTSIKPLRYLFLNLLKMMKQ